MDKCTSLDALYSEPLIHKEDLVREIDRLLHAAKQRTGSMTEPSNPYKINIYWDDSKDEDACFDAMGKYVRHFSARYSKDTLPQLLADIAALNVEIE